MSNKLVLKNKSLVLYKKIVNVFIRAIVRIFSFGERLILPLNSAIASLNGTINLSPHENILTIALINIYYLYIIYRLEGPDGKIFCRVSLFSEPNSFYKTKIVKYAFLHGKHL